MRGKKDIINLQNQLASLKAEVSALREELDIYISKDEQVILTYEASIKREKSVLNSLNVEEKHDYANDCKRYLQYGAELDKSINKKLYQTESIWVGNIKDVLKSVGCNENDMLYIAQGHLRNIMKTTGSAKMDDYCHYHNLNIEVIRQLPELLESPLAIIESKKRPNAIIVITDKKNMSGEQIMVVIQRGGNACHNGQRVKANFILSVYGKRNINNYLEMYERDILYVDTKKISTSLGLKPLQLRQFLKTSTYNNILHETDENVNTISQKNEQKSDPKFGSLGRRKP